MPDRLQIEPLLRVYHNSELHSQLPDHSLRN
jgi:hypothetical protein